MLRIGDKIKKIRDLNGYTQDDLAKKLGISKSTIGMYEQNRRSPDLDILLRISETFNVSVDYMLKDGRNQDSSADKKMLHKLIELIPEEDIEIIFQVLVKFVP